MSLLSCSTTPRGTPAPVATVNQPVPSKPGTASSETVGMSGSTGLRVFAGDGQAADLAGCARWGPRS